jgi:hypothetical protein
MIFMRIWTALLAGTCAAFVSTLFYATATGLISSPPVNRQTLYNVFLLAWLFMSLVCAIPARPLGQWLAAVRVSVILLGTVCVVELLTSRDLVTLAVTAIFAGLLTLLSYALTGPRAKQNTGR